MDAELYLQSLDEESRAAIEKLEAFFAEFEPLIENFIENFLEAVRELWEKIRAAFWEAFKWILPRLRQMYEDLQRAEAYTRLRAWHVPHWIAAPIGAYWPRRWLPHRLSYLFDKIAQKS